MSTEGLSPVKLAILSMWEDVRDLILSPECDDEAIMVNANKISILNQGSFREDEYMTYDDAMKELGIGYNRNRLSTLAKKYGIKSRKFKNSPAGFHKDDISRLKLILATKDNKTTGQQ